MLYLQSGVHRINVKVTWGGWINDTQTKNEDYGC